MDLKVDPTGAVDPEKAASRIKNLAPVVGVVNYRTGDRNASTAFAPDFPHPPPPPAPAPARPSVNFAPEPPHNYGSNALVVQRPPPPEIHVSPGKPLDLSRIDAIHVDQGFQNNMQFRPSQQLYSPLAQEALSLLNRKPFMPNAVELTSAYDPSR